MRIGDLSIPDGCALAPMAGVTDAPFRLLCREMGAAFAVTEMLSAKGFLYAPRGTRAERELLCRAAGEDRLGLQLFGRDPALVAEAANQLSGLGFAFIDINMGCPAKKIVSGGEGSALLKEPALAEAVVRATARATKLPVTVKLRAGWDADSIVAPELAKRLAGAGARMVTIHARTREQFYGGRADWDLIRRVKEAVDVPVVGNGDIQCAEDFCRMLGETGCDGAMAGRGAQGNPWLFREVVCVLHGLPCQKPTVAERARLAIRHLDMMAVTKGERGALLEMRHHIAWYLKGFAGSAGLRARVNEMTDLRAVREALIGLL